MHDGPVPKPDGSPPVPSSRLRQFATVLAPVVVAIVILVAIEGAVSLGMLVHDVAAITPAGNFRKAAYDSLVGWVGEPNLSVPDNFGPGLSLTHNANGIRINRPVTPALRPGEHRVICSGDSFTYGSGVADSQTFCAYLEPKFPGLLSLNMAQQGYGIDQAYLWYKRDGGKYPHQLHLFAFIWNDFERMALTSFWGYAKPILKLKDGRLVVHNVPVPQWTGSTRWSQAASLVPESRLMQLVERHVDMSEAAQMGRIDDQVMNVADSVFADLQRLNRKRGSTLVLVYLPTQSDLPVGAYDTRRKKLAEFSRRSGIALIDLTDDMRKVDPDSSDWFFITPHALPVRGSGGHYTAAGHRWTADRLAEHLKSMPDVVAALGAGVP